MGILRRIFGGSATRDLNLNATYFTRIRDDATLEVVGEAYRQRQVASARPPGPQDLPPGLPAPPHGYYKAMLIPEPTNRYDPNAIGVYLWSGGNWTIAGYLSRGDAVNYQPLFRRLAETTQGATPSIACDAALTTERGGKGVVVHLGTPGGCMVELQTDDREPGEHPWVGKRIVFTGQGATTIYGVPLDRAAQIMLARWAGCEVMPRLTKKCDALIVADPTELTGNLQKATEYGVAIVQESEFVTGLGMAPTAVSRLSGRWAHA